MTEEQIYKVPEEDTGTEEAPQSTASAPAPTRQRPDDAGLVLGLVLIVVGGLLLAGRVLHIDVFAFLRHLFWPFYNI